MYEYTVLQTICINALYIYIYTIEFFILTIQYFIDLCLYNIICYRFNGNTYNAKTLKKHQTKIHIQYLYKNNVFDCALSSYNLDLRQLCPYMV